MLSVAVVGLSGLYFVPEREMRQTEKRIFCHGCVFCRRGKIVSVAIESAYITSFWEEETGNMCCRYYLDESPELKPYVDEAKGSSLSVKMSQEGKLLKTEGEIRPTDTVPVLAKNRQGKSAVFPMIWGFTTRSAPLFNARSETAHLKPSFREAFERRRCVIPCSRYFEWEHILLSNGKNKTGDRYSIRPAGETLTWLAGLYHFETDGFPHFVVLTREPGENIRFIHNRMPVILPEKEIRKWIYDLPEKNWLEDTALTEMDFQMG